METLPLNTNRMDSLSPLPLKPENLIGDISECFHMMSVPIRRQ
jgi:hypothetical protein